jgi:hypothetical protein
MDNADVAKTQNLGQRASQAFGHAASPPLPVHATHRGMATHKDALAVTEPAALTLAELPPALLLEVLSRLPGLPPALRGGVPRLARGGE